MTGEAAAQGPSGLPRGSLRGRASWALADQAASSVGNFAISLVTLRVLSVSSLGAFAIAFAVYQFALFSSRALVSEPLVMRFSAARGETLRKASAGSASAAGVLGVLAGCILLLIGMVLHGAIQSSIVTLALAIPGLLLQDAWRYVFFAAGRPKAAALNDLVWTTFEILAIAVLVAADKATVGTLILCWGGGAAIAAGFGSLQARINPFHVSRAIEWIRQERDLGLPLLIEFLADGGAFQLSTFGIGVIAGLSELGNIRAAQVMFGPLYLFFMSAQVFVIPELVRLRNTNFAAVRKASALFAAALGAATCIWALSLFVIPARLISKVIGNSGWQAAHTVVVPFTIFVFGASAIISARVVLRATAAVTRSLRARLVMAPVTIMSACVGAGVANAGGAAAGLAIANLIGAFVWWRQAHRELLSWARRPNEMASA